MSTHAISVTVNGTVQQAEVEARLLLVQFLREHLRLTGTPIGCDSTHCGACTVLLDGKPVKSCTLFAVQAHAGQVGTIEGLELGGELHAVQKAFSAEHALQCGFCTPGMIMSAVALLERNPSPSELEIRQAISGNPCWCQGDANAVRAIQAAAADMREARHTPVYVPVQPSARAAT
jgi:carbon-monoxide dehydrogenase small subunit